MSEFGITITHNYGVTHSENITTKSQNSENSSSKQKKTLRDQNHNGNSGVADINLKEKTDLGNDKPCKGCGREGHGRDKCPFKKHRNFNDSEESFKKSEKGLLWLNKDENKNLALHFPQKSAAHA